MRRRASSRIARLEAKPRRRQEDGGQERARAIVERILETEEGREAVQAYATAVEKCAGDHNEAVREMLKDDSSREALARLGESWIEAEQSMETDPCAVLEVPGC